jgi:hypothetical protein
MILVSFLLLLLLATLIALIFGINALWQTLRTGLPFVTTPDWAIEWLRQNLRVQPKDVVIEIGCGDARVIAALAQQFPTARFVGIEIQWWPFLLAKWRTRKLKNISIVHGDIYKYDLSRAMIVYGFYITNFMDRLRTKLRNELLPGTKVISYGFRFADWNPIQEVPSPKGRGSSIVVYER